jgi:hypothetical protein
MPGPFPRMPPTVPVQQLPTSSSCSSPPVVLLFLAGNSPTHVADLTAFGWAVLINLLPPSGLHASFPCKVAIFLAKCNPRSIPVSSQCMLRRALILRVAFLGCISGNRNGRGGHSGYNSHDLLPVLALSPRNIPRELAAPPRLGENQQYRSVSLPPYRTLRWQSTLAWPGYEHASSCIHAHGSKEDLA